MLKLIVSRDWHCPQRIFMDRAQLLVIVYFLNSTKVKKLKKVEIVLWNAGVNITTLKCRGEYCCWNDTVEIVLWNAGVNIATLKCMGWLLLLWNAGVNIAAEMPSWKFYSEMQGCILLLGNAGVNIAAEMPLWKLYSEMQGWILLLWNAGVNIAAEMPLWKLFSEMQRWILLLKCHCGNYTLKCRGEYCYSEMQGENCCWNVMVGIVLWNVGIDTLEYRGGHCCPEMQRWALLP